MSGVERVDMAELDRAEMFKMWSAIASVEIADMAYILSVLNG